MFNLNALIANIPALLVGFAVHEFAHAWAADRLGDPTPRSQGRLTLNPIVHLDIFGTLMAALYQFGWAKPVQTQPHYFRGNKKLGQIFVSVAGPFANFIFAFIAMFFWVLTMALIGDSSWSPALSQIFSAMVVLNLGLGIFNLLPIPPLDGFSVVKGFVPGRYGNVIRTIENYGLFILVIILFTNFVGIILRPAVAGLFSFYYNTAYLFLSPFFG